MKTRTTKNILAKNVMRTDVATVRPEDSLQSAVELLEELHISGAPVVNSTGELVGMISASDVARFVRETRTDRQPVTERARLSELEDDISEVDGVLDVDDYSEELLGQQRVCDWMTPRVISVGPDSELRDICRLMTREAVHRVVVAHDKTLIGIITSTDVVRCVAEHGTGA